MVVGAAVEEEDLPEAVVDALETTAEAAVACREIAAATATATTRNSRKHRKSLRKEEEEGAEDAVAIPANAGA